MKILKNTATIYTSQLWHVSLTPNLENSKFEEVFSKERIYLLASRQDQGYPPVKECTRDSSLWKEVLMSKEHELKCQFKPPTSGLRYDFLST